MTEFLDVCHQIWLSTQILTVVDEPAFLAPPTRVQCMNNPELRQAKKVIGIVSEVTFVLSNLFQAQSEVLWRGA